MTKLKVAGEEFEVKSRLEASGVPFSNEEENGRYRTLHNRFRVTVCSKHTNKCRSFKYHGSQNDMEAGKDKLSAEDEKFAFRSFIDDSISGTMDFHEFCSEYGYDEDSRRAEKIHKAVKRSLKQAEDLGLSENELYDIINGLSKQGIE